MSSPEEHQPLLTRRASTREHERLQFQRAQEQAVGDVAASGEGLPVRFLRFLINFSFVSAIALYLYMYFGSIYIILFHIDKECDKPLGLWLVIWMILPTLQALVDPRIDGDTDEHITWQQRRTQRQIVIHSTWFLTGYVWMFTARTCEKTNAELYDWVHFVIHVYLVAVWMLVLAPLLLAFGYVFALRLLQSLIDNGYISNPNAASPGTIDLLETVPYDKTLFAMDCDPSDKRPSGECCCCTDSFGPGQEIVRTGCGHYYHKACLGEWLKLARTCPLCRCNLDGSEDAGEKVSAVPRVEDGDEELARRLQEEEIARLANLA